MNLFLEWKENCRLRDQIAILKSDSARVVADNIVLQDAINAIAASLAVDQMEGVRACPERRLEAVVRSVARMQAHHDGHHQTDEAMRELVTFISNLFRVMLTSKPHNMSVTMVHDELGEMFISRILAARDALGMPPIRKEPNALSTE